MSSTTTIETLPVGGRGGGGSGGNFPGYRNAPLSNAPTPAPQQVYYIMCLRRRPLYIITMSSTITRYGKYVIFNLKASTSRPNTSRTRPRLMTESQVIVQNIAINAIPQILTFMSYLISF